MPKHNNAVPKVQNHMRKHWRSLVKTWFNQAGRKSRRLQNRISKAKSSFPNPLNKLRPVVHKPTARYSGQERLGKGFTLEELKLAGISAKFAQTVGICVDYRRTNSDADMLKKNADRLKLYKEKLVLLPLHAGKARKGTNGRLSDSGDKHELIQNKTEQVVPVVSKRLREKPVKITKEMKEFKAYSTLQTERMNKKWAGKRATRKEEEKK